MKQRGKDDNKRARAENETGSEVTASWELDCEGEINFLWADAGAESIFRSKTDFIGWLATPNVSLAGKAPMQYLKSDIQVVANLLGRLLYGVLA